MKAPIAFLAMRYASRNRRLARDLRTLERGMAVSVQANHDLAERVTAVAAERDGWKCRAEALYDACPVDMRDEILGTINTIERLPVVEP